MTELSNRTESSLDQSAQKPNTVDCLNEFRLSAPAENSSLSRTQMMERQSASLQDGSLIIPPLFANLTEAGAGSARRELSNQTPADGPSFKMPDAHPVAKGEAPPPVEVEKITPEYLKSIDGKDVLSKGLSWAAHYMIEAPLKKQNDGTATSTTPDGCTITKNKDGSIEVKEKDGSSRLFQTEPNWKVTFKDKNGKEVVYDKLAENTEDPKQPILKSRLRDGGTSEYKFPDGFKATFKNKNGMPGGFVFETAKGVKVETFNTNTVQYSKLKDDY